MLTYGLLRCALLGTMENSEPRYTLELMPVLMVCAAGALGGVRIWSVQPAPAAMEEIAT
jgi:hypothetical protein